DLSRNVGTELADPEVPVQRPFGTGLLPCGIFLIRCDCPLCHVSPSSRHYRSVDCTASSNAALSLGVRPERVGWGRLGGVGWTCIHTVLISALVPVANTAARARGSSGACRTIAPRADPGP